MDYEKKYKLTLDRIKVLIANVESGSKDRINIVDIQEIFSELAEIKNEKTRKELIFFLEQEIPQCSIKEHADKLKQFIAWLEKQGEQKPVKTPQWMIDFLNEHRSNFGHAVDHDERRDIEGKLLCIKQWLKGNPNIEQKHVEWSEEDEKLFKTALWHISHSISNGKSTDCHCDTTDWLKSLKDRVQPQPRQEWSEEDTNNLTEVCNILLGSAKTYGYAKKYINWLKSLRPQNTWKPSELQIEALESATENCAYSEYQDCLRELIGQLKELK